MNNLVSVKSIFPNLVLSIISACIERDKQCLLGISVFDICISYYSNLIVYRRNNNLKSI